MKAEPGHGRCVRHAALGCASPRCAAPRCARLGPWRGWVRWFRSDRGPGLTTTGAARAPASRKFIQCAFMRRCLCTPAAPPE
eukprot:CAMPEP_0180663688 /NCGR_PEP_ID=MMETSP1037_2-20121125/60135_1 /TAXON_ID=632150 /ORGANISM="Azadinium spinosum, Strain 3D9" /LENGTH=81 /DNA_ID=CAMNT_0022691587 /DNA_START=32 /DNA_END=274 /DNA_ORIENTATION=-